MTNSLLVNNHCPFSMAIHHASDPSLLFDALCILIAKILHNRQNTCAGRCPSIAPSFAMTDCMPVPAPAGAWGGAQKNSSAAAGKAPQRSYGEQAIVPVGTWARSLFGSASGSRVDRETLKTATGPRSWAAAGREEGTPRLRPPPFPSTGAVIASGKDLGLSPGEGTRQSALILRLGCWPSLATRSG